MAQTVAQQMAANSAAWKTATPAQQAVLHAANVALAAGTGQSYNSAAGTWSAPTTPSAPSTPAPTVSKSSSNSISSPAPVSSPQVNAASAPAANGTIAQQMAANSAAYKTASLDEQARLHADNLRLAGLLGESYNPTDGTYTEPNPNAQYKGTDQVPATDTDLPPVVQSAPLANTDTSTDMLNKIMASIKAYQAPVTPTLSWQDAMTQAGSVLNPEFNNEDTALGTGVDQANIATGFYGQMPGEVLKTETLQKNQNNRNNSIATLANQMVGQSQTAANESAQTALGNQNSLFSMIQAALNNVTTGKQNDTSNALALMNAQTAQSTANANNAKTANDVTLANKQFDLDAEMKRADLTLAQKAQVIDDAYKQGQISVEQANAATAALNANTSAAAQSWSTDPTNPDNIYKVSSANKMDSDLGEEAKDKVFKANYNQAYGHFAAMDPQAALTDLTTHSDYYIGQMGTYYNTMVKEMQALAAKNSAGNLPVIK